MEPKKIALLIGGVVIAGTVVFAAKTFMASPPPAAPTAVSKVVSPKPVDTGPEVLVANTTLPVGKFLTAADFKFQPWPKNMVKGVYYLKDQTNLDSLVGALVRQPIAKGTPLAMGMLVDPKDRGFLAAALQPGMRAVTIATSGVSAAGFMIFPGDRVDVLLSHNLPSADGRNVKVAQTILQNVRVLATGLSTQPLVEEGRTVPQSFTSVTLEVTPKMAELVEVSEETGSLSLTLRSIADSAAEFDRAVARGDVNLPENADEETIAQMANAMGGLPRLGAGAVSTGGDVSRLLPSRPALLPSQPAIRVYRGTQKEANGTPAQGGTLVSSSAAQEGGPR